MNGFRSPRHWSRELQVGAVSSLAALLGAAFIGSKSLWLDEAISVEVTDQSWSAFTDEVADREANMGLYYLLLHFWVKLGTDEAFIRLPSLAAAVAAVPFVYGIGRRLFDHRVGLVASVILAVNAFFVQYAQEARGYSLLLLLVTASSYFLIRGLTEHSNKFLVFYSCAMGLASYAHLFALFVLAGHLLFITFHARFRTRSAMGAIGAAGVLSLPIVAWAASRGSEQISWIEEPSVGDVLEVVTELSTGTYVGLVVYAVLVALTTLRGASEDASGDGQPWRVYFLWMWFYVPIAGALVVSLKTPILLPRYAIVSLAPLVVLVAVGLTRVRGKALAAGAAALVVGSSLAGTVGWYATDADPDWSVVAEYVVDTATTDDVVVFNPEFYRRAYSYYAPRISPPDELPHVAQSREDLRQSFEGRVLIVQVGEDPDSIGGELRALLGPLVTRRLATFGDELIVLEAHAVE